MDNFKKYKEVFVTSLDVAEHELSTLSYQSTAAWDSVGHMALVASLEDSFDVMMDTDDIIDFSSFEKGKEILKKYGIEV
jgi:acyl carrier protein